MAQIQDKYAYNPEFQEFLYREFDKTVVYATMDELGEFAFGSFDEAVKSFEKHKRNDTE